MPVEYAGDVDWCLICQGVWADGLYDLASTGMPGSRSFPSKNSRLWPDDRCYQFKTVCGFTGVTDKCLLQPTTRGRLRRCGFTDEDFKSSIFASSPCLVLAFYSVKALSGDCIKLSLTFEAYYKHKCLFNCTICKNVFSKIKFL